MFISKLYLFTINKGLITNNLYISRGIILGHSLFSTFVFVIFEAFIALGGISHYGFLIEGILSYPKILIRISPNSDNIVDFNL